MMSPMMILSSAKTRTNAAHHGAQTRQQLVHRERLGEVIVGADIETANAIALFGARRQHHDRRVARVLARAQAAANFDARRLRQHPVEHDQIRRAFVGDHQRFFAIVGDGDAIAFLLKIVFEQIGQGRFVFDDQHVCCLGHGV